MPPMLLTALAWFATGLQWVYTSMLLYLILFKSASLYTKHAILTIKTDTHTSKSPVKSMAVCLRYRPARNPAPTKINVQKRAYGWGEIEGSQSLTLTQHHARFYPIFKN
jgi:hypothetical protein